MGHDDLHPIAIWNEMLYGAHLVRLIQSRDSECVQHSSTLSGRFNEDRSVFEATELVFWGTIEGGTTVTRRWSGYALR